MSKVTNKLGEYVANKGINIKELSRATGIPYNAIYTSLRPDQRERDLRDIEFLAICRHLEVDPMRFAEDPDQVTG